MWERPTLEVLTQTLSNPSNPIGMRMRAAYYLRQTHPEQPKHVVDVLSKGLSDVRHGALLRHEFAYIMGQLRDEQCCAILEQILVHEDDNIMVRHEAAEALGAIGSHRSWSVLEEIVQLKQGNNNPMELVETCQLALNVMQWRMDGEDPATMPAVCACMLHPYSTTDPAPPHPTHTDWSCQELGDALLNAELPLFERYRAMFSLRNRGTDDAVQQLCRALVEDSSSALLRHEVAYVLGQMQSPLAIDALEESLRRVHEHSMVRHESAEALGAIDGGRWEDIERILTEFTNDVDSVVRESCLVALDAADYWGRNISNNSESRDQETSPISLFASQKAEPSVFINHFNIKN